MVDVSIFQSVAEQLMQSGEITVPGKKAVKVKRTSSMRLRTVEFEVNGHLFQAIEQNPEKPSRWGQLAREGHRVVQFRDVSTGRYVAVAVDGKLREYATKDS